MKKRNILFFVGFAAAVLFAAACQRDETEPTPHVPAERLPASLSLTLNASDIRAAIETRNLRDPDGSGDWSEDELLADGRTIRRLTVLLIDSISRQMVAYRHIMCPDGAEKPIHIPMLRGDDEPQGGNGFLDGSNKVDITRPYSDKVRLTFNYDHPLHGDVERLKHGKYVLIAIANYGSLPITDDNPEDPKDPINNHDAVSGCNGLVKQLHAVLHSFYGDSDLKLNDTQMSDMTFLSTGGVGIDNFGATFAKFYNYILSVATYKDENGVTHQPYIRKKLDALPLFTVGYIDLQPGPNDITEPIPLYRTYARVRIEVRNYSTFPLDVYGLKFSKNFSKDKTYFCRMPGAANIFDGLDYTSGAPDVSYGESIIAFPYSNTNLRKKSAPDEVYHPTGKFYIIEDTENRDEVGSGQSFIKQGQTAAIFDAYISASRLDPNDSDESMRKYTYTIDLGYEGIEGYTSYTVKDGGPLSGSDPGSGAYYAVKVANTSQWLREADNATLDIETFDDRALNNRISEKNARLVWRLNKNGSSYRLQNVDTGDYIYGNNNAFTCGSTPSNFTVDGKGGEFIFSYTYNRTSYYMYYNGSKVSPSNWNSSSFELYPIDYYDSPRKSVTVDLKTFDNQTSAVTDVTEINRNDFVNVLVEVSYNPDKGDFEFEVEPWTQDKGGNITFN